MRPPVASPAVRRSATPVVVTTLALAFLLAGAVAHGQESSSEDGPIEVVIDPPARVVLGDRGEIAARVALSEGAGTPLLVTPTSEGPAIEIVRGRLVRADAEDATARPLRFRIPFVARTVGTSVVRVRVDGFACALERCRAVQVEASVAIEVLPP